MAEETKIDLANLPTGLPSEDPVNLFEWMWRTREYEEEIFIRVYRNGRWDNVSLKEATPQEWAAFMTRALERGMLPVRIPRESEMTKDPVEPAPDAATKDV